MSSSGIIGPPKIEFLLKQVYAAHKDIVKGFQQEIQELKATILQLQRKLNLSDPSNREISSVYHKRRCPREMIALTGGRVVKKSKPVEEKVSNKVHHQASLAMGSPLVPKTSINTLSLMKMSEDKQTPLTKHKALSQPVHMENNTYSNLACNGKKMNVAYLPETVDDNFVDSKKSNPNFNHCYVSETLQIDLSDSPTDEDSVNDKGKMSKGEEKIVNSPDLILDTPEKDDGSISLLRQSIGFNLIHDDKMDTADSRIAKRTISSLDKLSKDGLGFIETFTEQLNCQKIFHCSRSEAPHRPNQYEKDNVELYPSELSEMSSSQDTSSVQCPSPVFLNCSDNRNILCSLVKKRIQDVKRNDTEQEIVDNHETELITVCDQKIPTNSIMKIEKSEKIKEKMITLEEKSIDLNVISITSPQRNKDVSKTIKMKKDIAITSTPICEELSDSDVSPNEHDPDETYLSFFEHGKPDGVIKIEECDEYGGTDPHDTPQKAEGKSSPHYKFKNSPVRKKEDRKKLEGHDCKSCKEYYVSIGLTDEQIAQRLKDCSRHRHKYIPPPSPDHFWSLDFPSTQESKERGYIKPTQHCPLQKRRRRPLMDD